MADNIAITYGTKEGQTEKIAAYLADRFREAGWEVETADARYGTDHVEFDELDGIIVGASVHVGRYPRHVGRILEEQHDNLRELPSAFFSVSLTEAEDSEEPKAELRETIDEFLDRHRWDPDLVDSFAGALPFSQYGFFKTWLMKFIVRGKFDEKIDTSRDYEYTDWEKVADFADRFVQLLPASSRPEAPPPSGP